MDGTNVVREFQSGIVTATYLLGPQGPLSRRPANSSDVRWYVYDGLGSVVGEVNVNGNVTGTKKHDVYGLTRSTSGSPASKHDWVGQLGHTSDEETGLVYMRARHYDPVTGRFISEDPKGDGNNWFAYCNNDPVNSVDPDGRVSKFLLMFYWEGVFELVARNVTVLGFEIVAGILRSEAQILLLQANALEKQGTSEIAAGKGLENMGGAAGALGGALRSAGASMIKSGGQKVAEATVMRIISGQLKALAEMIDQGQWIRA